jgi:hypothetical protein
MGVSVFILFGHDRMSENAILLYRHSIFRCMERRRTLQQQRKKMEAGCVFMP